MGTITWEDGGLRWTAMASPVSLHLPQVDRAVAMEVAEAVRQDIEITEDALSRFRPDTDLVRLNERVGAWTEVSPRLYSALASALRAFQRTGGLFDPRILRRLEDYGYRGAGRQAGVSQAPAKGAWLERQPRRQAVRTLAPLDLGGIGKGLGVRWGARIAREVSGNFLLNAGGDLLAAGAGPEGDGWQIGVEDPREPHSLIAALNLTAEAAVCTSSVARRRWEHAGRPVHHLIDPRTGEPGGKGLLSTTVVGPDPAWTEVWSKALFLHGKAGIAAAAGDRPVLWVTANGELGMTRSAEGLVFWRAPGEHA